MTARCIRSHDEKNSAVLNAPLMLIVRGEHSLSIRTQAGQCMPLNDRCIGFPRSDLGGECGEERACNEGASVCAVYEDISHCSKPCQSYYDCDMPGFSTCWGDECRPDWSYGPDGCGRMPNGSVPSCETGCPDGHACLADLMPSILSGSKSLRT